MSNQNPNQTAPGMNPQSYVPPNLKINFDNFIGKFENAMEPEWCDQAIKFFDAMDEKGFCRTRYELNGTPSHISDTVNLNATRLATHGIKSMQFVGVPDIQDHWLQRIWALFEIYTEKFSSLRTQTPMQMYEMKIQKYDPGQGYHVWHWEQEGRQNMTRLLNIQCYLNDVEEGGGTEFLYYSRLEPAKKGTVLIYPGNYTHLHRGNPPRSGSKYIAISWMEF